MPTIVKMAPISTIAGPRTRSKSRKPVCSGPSGFNWLGIVGLTERVDDVKTPMIPKKQVCGEIFVGRMLILRPFFRVGLLPLLVTLDELLDFRVILGVVARFDWNVGWEDDE